MCNCGTTATGKFAGGIAGRAGDWVQKKGVKKFKSWFGVGDYTLQANSLIQGGTGGGVSTEPMMRTSQNFLEVTHSEYLGDVTTHPSIAGAFNLVYYEINPGLLLTFPWVSTLAQQYDQWIPMGIIFEFKSTATTYSTNPSLGSVIMATEYDVSDPIYASKFEMLQSAYSSESVVSNSQIHGIECDPSVNQHEVFFVRTEGASLNGIDDIKDYDLGRFCIATQGGTLAPASSVGSLYVHYNFRFLKEQIYAGLPFQNYRFTTWRGQITNSSNWGNLIRVAGRDLGITFAISGMQITIPKKWAGGAFKFTFAGNTVDIGGLELNFATPPTIVNGTFRVITDNMGLRTGGPADAIYLNSCPNGTATVVQRATWQMIVDVGNNITTDCVFTWATSPFGDPSRVLDVFFVLAEAMPVGNTLNRIG